MEYYDDMSQIIKVLIISYYFPPSNSVGAVRMGALYNFLIKHGYEVKIICFDENSTSNPINKTVKNKSIKKLRLSICQEGLVICLASLLV